MEHITRSKFNKRGQSIIELLIAMGLVGFFIGGAVLSAQLALRLSSQNKNLQAASFLAQEILDNFSAVAGRDWHRVDTYGSDALAVSPAEYHVLTAATPFVIASGSDSVVVDGVTYSRYFTIDKVSRDAGEAVETVYVSADEDPGTLKITANVEWGTNSKVDVSKFVTRYKNDKSIQTDWSSGSGQSGVIGDPGKYDTADSGINVTSKKGSIRISGIAYP